MTNGWPGLSRRDFLRYSGIVTAAVAGGSILTACGGESGQTSGGGGGPQQTGGVFIHGATGGSAKDTLDPHAPVTNPDIARVSNLFEPLLFLNNNYELEPALAESVEHNAEATEWTVRLREGALFHHGKTVTADDVLFTIQRVANPQNPTSAGGELSKVIDFGATTKVDERTIKLVLSRPYALVDVLLAEYTFGIIPTDFDLKNPVGTGPFRYESFTPGQTSTFNKFPDYWGTPAFVDQLIVQDFADDNAKVNALIAQQVQTIDNLPTNLIDSVKSQGGEALVSQTGAWVPFTMRVDVAPFSDVRVRQALRLIVDRQQMIDQALNGYGFLGNDLYAPFDPAYAKDLPQRTQDIDQARSLLRQAGHDGLQVELFTGDDISSVAIASANLFAQQAKAAGVDVRITKKTPFYGDDYLSYTFAQDFWNTRSYIPQAAVCALKDGTYNETHFDHPEFASLIERATQETDAAKRAELIHDAQEIEYNEGGYIIWGFREQIDGVGPGVRGVEPSKYLPLGSYKFQRASLA